MDSATETLSLWQNLLMMPEVQSVALPFLVAVIVALALRPLGWYWSGLALAAGFYSAAYVIGVIKMVPLTSTSKIMLLGMLAVLIGLLVDLFRGNRRQSFPLLFALAGGGVIWLLWPLLSRQPLAEMAPITLAAIAYLGWLAAWSDGLRTDPLRAAGAGWILALAVGAAATIGASAKLGQLAIALGVTAGAFWLLAIFMPKLRGGSLFAAPVLVLGGLLSVAGVVFAKVPIYTFVPLALIPLLAKIPLPASLSRLSQGVLSAALMLPAGIVAVVLSGWLNTGDSGY